MAKRRLELIAGLTMLDLTLDAETLAESVLHSGLLPTTTRQRPRRSCASGPGSPPRRRNTASGSRRNAIRFPSRGHPGSDGSRRTGETAVTSI